MREAEFTRVNPPDVITVFPAPAPITFTATLVIVTKPLQVAVPAATLIVSPERAFCTQLLTLLWSGVLFQLGLEPEQLADAMVGEQTKENAVKTKIPMGGKNFFI